MPQRSETCLDHLLRVPLRCPDLALHDRQVRIGVALGLESGGRIVPLLVGPDLASLELTRRQFEHLADLPRDRFWVTVFDIATL